MLLPTLLSTTALALTAKAFLVPLEVANEAVDAKVAHFDPTTLGTTEQLYKLDCSTCPFALASTRNGVHEWTAGVKSDLEMKFTTESKQLLLNGAVIYPTSLIQTKPVLAKQTLKDAEESADGKKWEAYEKPLGMSYSLELNEQLTNEGVIVEVELQVFGLESEVINVDTIVVRVVKKPDGEVRPAFLLIVLALPKVLLQPKKEDAANFTGASQLLIASINTHPSTISPEGQKCATVWCRMFAMIKTKMASFRAHAAKAAQKIKSGCMAKIRPHARPMAPHHGPKVHGGKPKFSKPTPVHDENGVPQPGPHGGHKVHHGHHGHHHHHGFSSFVHSFTRVLKHVLLPILVGIATGMAVGALAMLIGSLVVFVMKRRERKQGGTYERLEQSEKEDGLPSYEDLEATVVVGDEKAQTV
ncbi:hypothetical protein MMC06_004517 [Schaereria dolodes]|nr:hypothetical protein [Schaereria dolodes]